MYTLVGGKSVGNGLVVGVDDIEGKNVILGSIVVVGKGLFVGVDDNEVGLVLLGAT